MEIIYKDEILYVNVLDNVNKILVSKLEKRVFRIIEDYDIDNIVINIMSDTKYDNDLFNNFLKVFKEKYQGLIKIN